MAEQRDLGQVYFISAEAVGQPGQRRFRLRAAGENGDSASLWMEKEQLIALGDALETVLQSEDYHYQRTPLDDMEPAPVYALSADYDFRIGQLSMGLNREGQTVVLLVADAADPEDAELSLSLTLDFRRAYELRGEITTVVAAGRPPCPLCGGPLDPSGHVCPRSNGHHERAG